MRIAIKNIGAIKQAEFELGELTIICGENNTGKTYATYALFGFLSFWQDALSIKISNEEIEKLFSFGFIRLDIQKYINDSPDILKESCTKFTGELPHLFASAEKNFIGSQFLVDLEVKDANISYGRVYTMGTTKTQLISIAKKEDSPIVSIALLVEKEKEQVSRLLIGKIIGKALQKIVFGHLFPNPFIASAERTGAVMFRKELNFARNRLLEEMRSGDKKINPLELLSTVYSDCALPVKRTVNFASQVEGMINEESDIFRQYPEILKDFSDIIGGTYSVTKNDELYYIPKGKRIKLTMNESSSSVRSLLDIGFYLRHVASIGDLLMVDEPELNLHPENQRRVARLLARLVNIGIKVLITTHSDYIIKELNTLIMLNQMGERFKMIATREKYHPDELLDSNKVRVYIAEEASILLDGAKRKTRCQTLVPADIDPKMGIEARSFDTTIEKMNLIQEEIVWGGDL